MFEFMSELSIIGWLGVAVWVSFPILFVVKMNWFINYDERFPKSDIVEEYVYTETARWIYMTVRLVVIIMVFYVVGKILTLI